MTRHVIDDAVAVPDNAAILARARTGTRLMTIRGAAMRTISVAANLLLIVLVSPSQLGLLAVARGTFTLLQYIGEMGVGKALLRRSEAPTAAEYAALSGMQILVTLLVVAIGAVWSAPILGFGAIEKQWHVWMLGTVATMMSLAMGTGARVRLQRALAYERLAVVDVLNVLTLNVGLVIAALLHQFSAGVFVVLGVATVIANSLMWYWAPGPKPSANLRPLRDIARESSGFLASSTCAVIREQGTPVLIGGLFGLQIAGLYSFAERLAQLLNVTFDGFKNACIPAAVRLAHDAPSLRSLATRTLVGSALLTLPLAVIAACGLPVLAEFVPKWSNAVVLTQWYLIAYAIYGVACATLEPVAVATRGARVSLAQESSALIAGWGSFLIVRATDVKYMPLAVVAMYVAPLVVLWQMSRKDTRAEYNPDAAKIAAAFIASLALYSALRALGQSPIVCAVLPTLVAAATVMHVRGVLNVLRTWLRRPQADT